MNYLLTLFTLASSRALPAINANEHIPSVGWCATRINPAETAIQLSCEQAGRGPDCMTLILEHIQPDKEIRSASAAMQTMLLNRDWQFIPDGLARFGGALACRDPNGLAKYPVNGSKLALMQIYRAADHFTRNLVIPEIRLKRLGGGAGGVSMSMTTLAALVLAGVLYAQTPRFEVASVRPANPSAPRGGRLALPPPQSQPLHALPLGMPV